MRIWQKLLILICTLSLMPLTLAQPQLEPIPIDVAISALSLTSHPIAVSPDGQWIAYTLQDPRKRRIAPRNSLFSFTGVPLFAVDCDVWITHVGFGRSQNLTAGTGSSWSPAWSPNGAYLSFYSDRSGKAALWVWKKSTGTLRRVSEVVVRSFSPWETVRWTPDSKSILIKVLSEDQASLALSESPKQTHDTDSADRPTAVLYSSAATARPGDSTKPLKHKPPDAFDTSVFFSDLALIEVNSGEVSRVARAVKVRWYSISPDSMSIAYTSLKRFEIGSQQVVFDLVVVSLADQRSRVVASNIKLSNAGTAVSWSPNGGLLSYIEGGPLASGDCYVVHVDTGEMHKATDQRHPSFDTWGRPPLWDAVGENIYLTGSDDFRLTREILSKPTPSLSDTSSDVLWKISLTSRLATALASIPNRDIEEIVSVGGNCIWSPDGGASCCLRTRDDHTKQAGFYKIALATGKSAKLLEEDKSYSSVSPNGHRIAYVAQDAKRPGDVWIADPEFARPEQLTRINPKFDQYSMGTSRLIEWRGLDGQVLRGALLLPADYKEGQQYPLIVHVYGGFSGSNTVNRFGLWLTSEDNMQLLATRRYAVLLPDAPLRQGTPMQDLAKVVLPGVNKVIELGIADPDRLGVMGSSYGGYSSLALIVQTPRFKAAIMKAGTGNLFSMYGEMGNDGSMNFGVGWAEDGQGRMGGTPWDLRERYIENSPVFYLDRVQTPLLIAQGTEDDTTAPFLSDEIFVDLRRLGREALYAKYTGEGHGFWGYANTVDYWKRMIDWFDGHLSPGKVNR